MNKKEGDLLAELNLGLEWKKQAERLARYFARPLGLSEIEYIDGLPPFPDKPRKYEGRLDIPLLVQPPIPNRLSIEKIMDILGFRPPAGPSRASQRFWGAPSEEGIEDWADGTFRTPQVPYSIWIDNGLIYSDRTASEVRTNLAQFERPATVIDGVFLYEFIWLKGQALPRLSFPGSKVGNYIPSIASYSSEERNRYLGGAWLSEGGAPVVTGVEIKIGVLPEISTPVKNEPVTRPSINRDIELFRSGDGLGYPRLPGRDVL